MYWRYAINIGLLYCVGKSPKIIYRLIYIVCNRLYIEQWVKEKLLLKFCITHKTDAVLWAIVIYELIVKQGRWVYILFEVVIETLMNPRACLVLCKVGKWNSISN